MDYVEYGNNYFQSFKKYVTLNVLSMLGVSAYILFDTYFIATCVGLDALAGLNIALPVFSFISAIGILIGMGTSVRYSIFCGENNKEKAIHTAVHGFIMALVSGIVFGIFGLIFGEQLMKLLGADEKLLPYSYRYISTLFIFTLPIILNGFFICLLRAAGYPKEATYCALFNSFTNFVLDYILVVVFKRGLWGAAIASGLAPCFTISAIVILSWFYFDRFEFEFPDIEKSKIIDVIQLGFPSFVTEYSTGFIMMLFNYAVLIYAGNVGVSAYSIIANIAIVVTAIFTGVAQGAQPLISYFHGAGKTFEIGEITRWTYSCVMVFAVLLYALFYCCSIPIINIFCVHDVKDVVPIADLGIKIFFSSLLFWGFNIINTHILVSKDNPQRSLWLSLARGGLLTIPMLFILSRYCGIIGIWATAPVVELMSMLMFL